MRNPLLQKKRSEHEKLIKKLGLTQNKCIGIISLKDTNILGHLIGWLKTLSVSFIVVHQNQISKEKESENIHYTKQVDEETLLWADFIIGDSEFWELEKYMKQGIVPIISKKNYLSSILSEFNPIKNEGNAFIYDQDNEWQIFYALCRYIENSKFSFDDQNLVNNVTKI